MKSVLISINKPHTDNIFTHKKKKIEWRKKPLPKTTNYCYETKNKGGCGKVIGQFDVVHNIEFDPLNHHLYSLDFIKDGCVPIEDLIEYANGDVIYGNVLEKIVGYDEPKELSEFYTPEWFRDCEKGCDDMERMRCPTKDSRKVDRMCGWCRKGGKPITRPPQSWCYVESAGAE